MKVIIAGSRNIIDYTVVKQAIEDSQFWISEVVSGTAKGVDLLGEFYAEHKKIPIKRFPANWKKFGKRAGYIRNSEMADYADALIAVWDGKSKGTANMIELAKKQGLEIFVAKIEVKT